MKEDKERDQGILNMRIVVFSLGAVVCTVFTIIRLVNGVPLIRAGFYEAASDVIALIGIPVFIVLLILLVREKRRGSKK